MQHLGTPTNPYGGGTLKWLFIIRNRVGLFKMERCGGLGVVRGSSFGRTVGLLGRKHY